jgi:hypothetical protein
MADPTDPTATPDPTTIASTTDAINDQTTAMDNLKKSTDAQQLSYNALNVVSDMVQTGMNGIEQAAKGAGLRLDDLSSITKQQTEQFGLLSSSFVNARVAFEGFTNVDYSGLSTFTEQIRDIKTALDNVPAAKATESLKMLGDALLKQGASQVQINAAMSKGKDAVLSLASNMAVHADNMLRAQTAYVQMAGRTGELGDAWIDAGKNLMNMDDILEKQQEMLKNSREATGLSAQATEKWYNQLGLIPGALKEQVSTGSKAGETTSMLTAVIQTATGSGREMSDVMQDLNVAFKDYGLVGEKALLFSVRMSDVSTRLKAPISDITTALRGSADAFKMFATGQEAAASSAESLADTLNTYGKALESTGLSASAAVEVAGNLANQVSKLSTGQLAFISQRTGGAGGLQGAAQETLKLQTDPGAVVRDAMKTLQQQFGRIVTVQEAATSESAASQNIKQTTLLQQLLGPLAKDQATANRLLEAMKNSNEGQPGAIADALKPTGVQDAAEKGVDLQAKSYGVLTESRNILEEIRDVGDRGAASMAGKVTAGSLDQQLSASQGALKGGLQDMMSAGRRRGSVSEGAQGDTAADLHRALLSIKDIPLALRASYDTLKQAFAKGDVGGAQKEEDMLAQQIAGQKQLAEQLKGNPAEQAKALGAANSAQMLLDSATGVKGSTEDTIRNAQQVSSAARNVPGTGSAPANTPGSGGGGPSDLNIKAHITIDCPHCGRPSNVSDQAKIYPSTNH